MADNHPAASQDDEAMQVLEQHEHELAHDTAAGGDDESTLAELGYKQELTRSMSGFSNFAVSFSIISVLAGCITSFAIAMNAGGPAAINIGWPIVGIFVLFVAMSMGEICSVYPTAGGLYFWAGRLARKRKAVWAWYVGWFNFLGEVAVTAAIDFGAATTWMAMFNLMFGWEVTAVRVFIAFAIILLLHGLLNTFGVNLVRLLSNVSAWWHLVGVAVIVAILFIVPDNHQSASFTFFHFENQTGWSSAPYAFLIGLLMAQYPTPASMPQPTSRRRPRMHRLLPPKVSSTACWFRSLLAGSC